MANFCPARVDYNIPVLREFGDVAEMISGLVRRAKSSKKRELQWSLSVRLLIIIMRGVESNLNNECRTINYPCIYCIKIFSEKIGRDLIGTATLQCWNHARNGWESFQSSTSSRCSNNYCVSAALHGIRSAVVFRVRNERDSTASRSFARLAMITDMSSFLSRGRKKKKRKSGKSPRTRKSPRSGPMMEEVVL